MPPAAFDTEAIRAALPLRIVCEREGLAFRREGANVKAPCPFHQERSGSFTIHGESPDRAHCYGCGWSGDLFAFWGEIRGIPCQDKEGFKTIVEQLASLAGIGPRLAGVAFTKKEIPQRKALSLSESRKPHLPTMRLLRSAEKAQLSALRYGISIAAIEAAEHDRRLGFCYWPLDRDGREDSRSAPSWVITDPERWTAQFRTLSGKPYVGAEGNEFKSYSTKNIAWSIGAAQTGDCEKIVLVEGGADMLAAYHFLCELDALSTVAVWCQFGTPRIAPEALKYARGKRVRIIADNDPPKEKVFKSRPAIAVRPGIEAAARWVDQFRNAGVASVDTYDLSPLGEEYGDLNDLIRHGYADIDIADIFNF